MSGSDQSARLEGMLSGIAGTVGELGVGGDWTSNAIRTVNRPDFMAGSNKVLGKYGRPAFDMDNVDNLNAMANWAERNDKQDEATRYMALSLATQERQRKEQEKKEEEAKDALRAKAVSLSTNTFSDGSAGADGGDPTQLEYNIRKIKEQITEAGTAGDLPLLGKLRTDLKELTGMRSGAVSNKVTKQAQAIPYYEKLLKDYPEGDPRREPMQKALRYLKNDPAIAEAYKQIQATQLTIDKGELTVEGLQYAIDRRPMQEMLEELQLQNAQYTLLAKEAQAVEARDIRTASGIAASNISAGQWILTEDQTQGMSGIAQAEARKIMGDEFKRREDMDKARSEATVGTATLAAAENLASTNPGIATMLNDYKTSKANALTLGDQKRTATQLTAAVHNLQLANADNNIVMESAVGGQMKAMIDLGSQSSLFEGEDYVDVMSDADNYLSMRKDIAKLATSQGLTPKDLNPETILELMDVAAGQSTEEAWLNASDKASRRRRAVEKEWRTAISEPQDEWVASVVATNKGKTAWDEDEIYVAATNYYEDAVKQVRTLVLQPRSLQVQTLSRMMNQDTDSLFRDREFGPPHNPMMMPKMFDLEDYEVMMELAMSGRKITYQDFITDQE